MCLCVCVSREWLQEAQEHCNVNNFEVFLVGTKRDLVVSVHSLGSSRIYSMIISHRS